MVKSIFRTLLLCAAGALWAPIEAQGQEDLAPQSHHAWAKFVPGSWKRVRLTTETVDSRGQVTGVTVKETTTTLAEVDASSYSLTVEVTIEVAGKRLPSQPRLFKHGFSGEAPGQVVSVKKIGTNELLVCARRFTTEIQQITVQGSDSRTISTVYTAEGTHPTVLKRETVATDLEGKQTLFQTQVDVVALEMPYRVLDEHKPAAFVKTFQKQGNGSSSITLEVLCHDVPGGVVAHTSKTLDRDNRVTERSVLELADFGVAELEEDGRSGRRRVILPRGRRKS